MDDHNRGKIVTKKALSRRKEMKQFESIDKG